MNAQRYDVSVQTLIYRSDGTLFADLGIMRFPAVSESVRLWLAESCRITANQLCGMHEVRNGPSFTIKYQTIVRNPGGSIESETPMLEFPGLAYADLVRFEEGAIIALADLLELFKAEHVAVPVAAQKRSRLKAWAGIGWAFAKHALARNPKPGYRSPKREKAIFDLSPTTQGGTR